jgi:lipopolysaccharide export system protein LptA
MNADSLRRATVFALLFGGAIGFLAWRVGGKLSAKSGADDERSPDVAPKPGASASIGPGLGVGASEDGVLSRDGVTTIDGRPVRYRAWTASWSKSTPRKSADPAVSVQDLVLPRVVLFPTPQSATAAPVKPGDPGTTTITAKTGALTFEKDVRSEARLEGDVAIDRFDPLRGDFRLRTASLVCTMESHGDVDKRHAQTAAPVVIDGGRAHVAGTGLDADLSGDACVATLLRDVKGRFDAASGSISMAGGRTDAKPSPTDVTCSGACEITSLGAAKRGVDRRWKATFHDDVHVTQGADSLDCDLLEVEFKMGETKADDGLPAQHVVATGHVFVKGATESRTYDVTCGKATHRREGVVGKERDVVVFEDSPVMNTYGAFATAAAVGGDAKKKSEGRGRMEIRCDGAATMTTWRPGNLATSPHRTYVVFLKNVVVRQWDDEKAAEVTGELHAQKATLYGTRLPTGAFQPDTLTAENDAPQGGPGVDLKRLDFASHSVAATWTRVADTDIDRYMLVGEPVVTYSGVKALHPFGKPTTSTDSRVTVESADNVTIDVYADRPPAAGEPPRPYATIAAGPRVVVIQTENGQEVARATADEDMRAVIAPGKQLEHVELNRNARCAGKTDDGQTREVEGARIVVDRLVLPPGAPKDAPHPAQVVALGDEKAKTQALAVVVEPNGDRDEVRADSLRYAQDGAVVFANGRVAATIDAKSRVEKPDSSASKFVQGPVRITAGEARVDLAPDASKAPGARKLLKVDASGGVVVDGTLDRVEGRRLVYDAVTGVAEVRGEQQTARVVYSAENAGYPSLLLADVILAHFDVSDDPATKGRLVRVVCPQGGRIIRYVDAPGAATAKPAAGSNPRLVRIESKGPMESTRTEATARDDVIARMFSLSPSGDADKELMTFYCQRARMTFDPDAPGRARDRLRTLDAVGDHGNQVVVETPDFSARADHLELDATAGTIKLSTDAGPDVYVRQVASGRQSMYDSAVYHYDTREWTDAERGRELEPARAPKFEKK